MITIKEEIEDLLCSDITGYKIAKETGIGESIISNLRNKKRNIDNLSVKNAVLLISFKRKHLGFINYSSISKNEQNNEYSITYEMVKKIELEDQKLYEIEYKYVDGIKITNDYDINEIKYQILSGGVSEGHLHVKNFKEVIFYVTMKSKLNIDLAELIKQEKTIKNC